MKLPDRVRSRTRRYREGTVKSCTLPIALPSVASYTVRWDDGATTVEDANSLVFLRAAEFGHLDAVPR